MSETEAEALGLARRVLGRAPDDEERPWRLREFGSGWLIEEQDDEDRSTIGAARRVIERHSGRIRRFPSSVPPRRILTDYAAVAQRGRIEELPARITST